jgi:hypothetical protein
MKKTLIALAALGVVGAASAQATISGEVAWGYQSVKNANITTTSQGWGVNTAKITFAGSEDLGGGLTVSASAAIDNIVEGSVVPDGKGVTLGLSGGFGSLLFATTEGGDFMLVDEVTTLGNGTVRDKIIYTTPSMSGLTGSVFYSDGKITTGDNSATDLPSASSSQDNSATLTILTAAYADGPIKASASTFQPGSAGTSYSSMLAWDVSYDFGVAAVRYANANMKLKSTNTAACGGTATGTCVATELRLTAPVGATSLTYASVSEKATSESTARTGSYFEVAYALSKRTSAVLAMQSHKTGVSTKVTGHENTFKLVHKF